MDIEQNSRNTPMTPEVPFQVHPEELAEAFQRKEFVLMYRPRMSCRSGAVVGLEAILHWQHPQHGLLEANSFLGILEKMELLVTVGNWMATSACLQLTAWQASAVGSVPITLNISSTQLLAFSFYDTVKNLINNTGLPPQYIELGLREGGLASDAEQIRLAMARFKALGVRFLLDDFGAGNFGLAELKRLPLDMLKVDAAFVENIIASPDDVTLLRAVITMAHALKLKVVAKGVADEGQLKVLLANQCDEIQGDWLSKPLPAANVVKMLGVRTTLPDLSLYAERPPRNLLLVDDEENILAAMKRLLRREGYTIHTATSGEAGLAILGNTHIDVIISDQRMPGMTGVEFLRRVKDLHPDTVRIVLSGYAELEAITSAINEGAIYKFLSKPWNDAQLIANIDEAFTSKEMADENNRLSDVVQWVNRELAETNTRLENMLAAQKIQLSLDEGALHVLHEILQLLPWPLIGVDTDGMIATVNSQAEEMFGAQGILLGSLAAKALPAQFLPLLEECPAELHTVDFNGITYNVLCRKLGAASAARGYVLILLPGNNNDD